jgi:uncharacterized circularly permuted ATP-grasp superfamily protein
MNAAAHWMTLARRSAGAELCGGLAARMRQRHLTFGGRLLCPFLRPFFFTARDEERVVQAATLLYTLGERVAARAVNDPALMSELGLSDAEASLAAIEPGYAVASTAARADAFLLPESLQFAEYNAESPAGAGYTQRLSELFDDEPLMREFRQRFDARYFAPIPLLLDALIESYRDWGGTAKPPRIAIVDWREVPTWSEFELIRDAFTALGVPTRIADPRDLDYDGTALRVAGERIDLVYRRVLINDIVARPAECRALVDAYRARAVCVANTLRCKISHKKALFAVLTDDRFKPLFSAEERTAIRRHVPWTRVVRDGSLVERLRENRDTLVLKPNDEYGGSGVTLGWETTAGAWDAAIERALSERPGTWIVQERIDVRRETFPVCTGEGVVERDMLVDFAPYLFRGKVAGYLTRLSSTGLANVTSGGGQVPAFVVDDKH